MNEKIKIAWFGKHFGEEPPISGSENQGAGAIFFSGCNLHCVFCQNFQISQNSLGKYFSVEELSEIMLELQRAGAVCIDLVTPTIWWQLIRQSILLAREKGLNLPIVWNSNAFESVEMLQQIEDVVDIYLPDFKYGDEKIAEKYSQVKNYPAVAESALREMFRQKGNLQLDENGIAKTGIIVRHLVLPDNLENSFKALQIISNIDKEIHVSLMNQYFPVFNAGDFSEINKTLDESDFEKVFDKQSESGLNNGWVQERGSSETFVPDFEKTNPFSF
ncbi:radical SAM protein [Patescibacteria group bacterium]|nr:radical SAM protein [Patescibacteria group bacterium]